MTQTILILIGLVIVVLLLWQKTRDRAIGICAAAIGLDAKKRERKEKVLALLGEHKELSNSDIREALGVSERSVVRYLDELEREGKVKQVGSTGRSVTYRLKQ